jgi:hypothetical protein
MFPTTHSSFKVISSQELVADFAQRYSERVSLWREKRLSWVGGQVCGGVVSFDVCLQTRPAALGPHGIAPLGVALSMDRDGVKETHP